MKPGKDISERLVGPGVTYQYVNGALVEDPQYVYWACTQQRDLHYPASVSRPIVNRRWRDPTSWYRSSWRDNPCPSGFLLGYLSYNPLYGTAHDRGAAVPLWYSSAPEAIPTELYNKAVNKALSKIKNQKVNLLQNFGEKEQAVQLFINTCHRIGGMYRAFRKKDPKGFFKALAAGSNKSHLRNLPESFLEFQYGVKPLVADVYGACDAIDKRKLTDESYDLMHVVGKASSKETRNWALGTRQNGWFQCTEDLEFRSQVHLYFYLENPLTHTLASLGVLNPAALIWELLPLSFAADWVVPVGQYLGLLDATAGMKFKAGTFSGFTKRTVNSYFQSGTSGYWRASYQGVPYHYEGYAYQRSLYDDFPMPQLTPFKPPWARDRTTHLANAIALVAANLRD